MEILNERFAFEIQDGMSADNNIPRYRFIQSKCVAIWCGSSKRLQVRVDSPRV
jgi:hypothetical protein